MGRSMFIYPWDLLDEGISKTLGLLKDMGMTSISLSVSYHSGKFLLPHNPKKRIYYHPSGRVYYQARYEEYKKLKPELGEAYKQYRAEGHRDDLLSRIIKEAKRLNMEVRAWVVGFHNSHLGKSHPEYVVRNLYGEPYYHALCPNYEETKHYALKMIEDLVTQYDLDAIELESFDYLGCLHGDHHEIIGIQNKQTLERFLGLCFCSNCEAKAEELGIDVNSFKKYLREKVDKISNLEGEVALEDIPYYAHYLTMRSNVVKELYRNIRMVISKTGRNITLNALVWMAGGSDPSLYGTSVNTLNPYIDNWIVCYPESVHDVESFILRARRMIPEEKLIAGIRLLEPQLTEAAQVIDYIEKYKNMGVGDLHFYNYGLIPNEILSELKRCFMTLSNKEEQ